MSVLPGVAVGTTCVDVAVGGRDVAVAVGMAVVACGAGVDVAVGNILSVGTGVSPAGGPLTPVVGTVASCVAVAVGSTDVAVAVLVAGAGAVVVAVPVGNRVADAVLVAVAEGSGVALLVGKLVPVGEGSGVALLVGVTRAVAVLVAVSAGVGEGTITINGPPPSVGVAVTLGAAGTVGTGVAVGGSGGAKRIIGPAVDVGVLVGRRVGVLVGAALFPELLFGVHVAVAPGGGTMRPDCSAGVGTGVVTGGPTSICAALADATISPASLTATTSTSKRPIVLTGVCAVHVPSAETVAVTRGRFSTNTWTEEPVGP